MKTRLHAIAALVPLLVFCTTAGAVQVIKPERFKEAFFEHMKKKADLDKTQRSHLKEVKGRVPAQTPAVEVVVQGLRAVYPSFSEALALLNSEKPEAAAEKLQPFLESKNPYLVHGAHYFRGRAHVMREDYEAALQDFAPVTEADGEDNPFMGEAWFETAMAKTRMVEPEAAREALQTFLEVAGQYGVPAARRHQAQRALIALATMQEGSIMEALQLMDDSRRRLKLERVGENTQEQQERIVAILDEIIEAAEEGDGGGGGGGGGQSQGGSQPGAAASGAPSGVQSSTPANQSSLPGGSASMGELGRSTRGRPGESWGTMPPNEREKVLSAIQEKFPNRYRELIEQYYKGLQESAQ